MIFKRFIYLFYTEREHACEWGEGQVEREKQNLIHDPEIMT